MHNHWQNLNEGGSAFWDGRAWLSLSKQDRPTCLAIEWGFGRHASFTMIQAGINHYDPKDIFLHIGILWLFNLYFSLQGYQLMRRIPNHRRQIGFSLHEDHFSWHLWCDPDEWRRGASRGARDARTKCVQPGKHCSRQHPTTDSRLSIADAERIGGEKR